uniref:Arylacetamide deacetylase n=1 Tax=Rousettus aegyptiacus TaxID=9407 RepID=A0A7J8HM82_ROUAE|nr:arylacetamide deacetylase [Rousettus aegyptiacus]
MGRKSLYLLIVGVLVAYYVYIPLPGDFEDPWKLILLNAKYKAVIHLAIFIELLGLNHFLASVRFFMDEKKVPPTSDENITVTDTTFNHIPVRVYVPKKQPKALRRGIFFIHGGGWSGNSAASQNYDLFSRWTADRLDTVVVSTNHRLLPEYRFPIQFEDVYSSFKWFLRKEVLAKYGVNPERIGVVGCSSGGNLAAAIVQKV